jgi:hypothetical protein
MHGGEDFRDATAYAKSLTVGESYLRFLEVMLLPVYTFYYQGTGPGFKSAQTVDSTAWQSKTCLVSHKWLVKQRIFP